MEDIKKSIRTYLARINPRPLLFFDVNLCNHCNLNCKSCGSFAPLVTEKDFLDFSEYKKDTERLSKLSNGVVHHINILGGSHYYILEY